MPEGGGTMYAVAAVIGGVPRGIVGTIGLMDALGMARELAGDGIGSGEPWSVIVTDRRTDGIVASIASE